MSVACGSRKNQVGVWLCQALACAQLVIKEVDPSNPYGFNGKAMHREIDKAISKLEDNLNNENCSYEDMRKECIRILELAIKILKS